MQTGNQMLEPARRKQEAASCKSADCRISGNASLAVRPFGAAFLGFHFSRELTDDASRSATTPRTAGRYSRSDAAR